MRLALVVLAIFSFSAFPTPMLAGTFASFDSILVTFALSAPSPNQGITQDSAGVTIRFHNQTLEAVLQKISDQTGIKFHLNYQISQTPIQIDITAPDWREAINALLGNQSRLEFWTGDPSTSKFWLMEGSLYDVESVKKLKKREETVSANGNNSPTHQNKVPADATQKTLSILPPHILFDPGLLLYLKSVGIALPIEFEMRFEPVLEGLPEDYPISQLVLSDPQFKKFIEYLESIGIEPPKS
jgi:hypothetical protein